MTSDAEMVSGHTFYELLRLPSANSDMQASLACDRIYGILGLATDTDRLGLRADYAHANRIDLSYARTTKALVANGRTAILTMVQ